MEAPLPKLVIGCIGKCTSGLTNEELDRMTDNISLTLDHPRSREIFKKYLKQRGLRDNLVCLELYENCCNFIDKRQSLPFGRYDREIDLESLIDDVRIARDMAEDLDGVPEIDMLLMQRFNEALRSRSSHDLLAVLEDTRYRICDHLRIVHNGFKRYVSEPCPMTK